MCNRTEAERRSIPFRLLAETTRTGSVIADQRLTITAHQRLSVFYLFVWLMHLIKIADLWLFSFDHAPIEKKPIFLRTHLGRQLWIQQQQACSSSCTALYGCLLGTRTVDVIRWGTGRQVISSVIFVTVLTFGQFVIFVVDIHICVARIYELGS